MPDLTIDHSLAALPEETRHILRLRFERGLDLGRIAALLHQPSAVVRQRLRLALMSAAREITRQRQARGAERAQCRSE